MALRSGIPVQEWRQEWESDERTVTTAFDILGRGKKKR